MFFLFLFYVSLIYSCGMWEEGNKSMLTVDMNRQFPAAHFYHDLLTLHHGLCKSSERRKNERKWRKRKWEWKQSSVEWGRAVWSEEEQCGWRASSEVEWGNISLNDFEFWKKLRLFSFRIISAAHDCTVKVWNQETQSKKKVFFSHFPLIT